MDSDRQYELLRNLTSPLVAVTSRADGDRTGMIANSAIRASLVPSQPRVAFYCFKTHYSHELITQSHRFCLHLLHRGQGDVVRTLGFESGRDHDKLGKLSLVSTDSGLPRIKDAYAWFGCRVINAMDAGPSTFFLGEAEEVKAHPRVDEMTLLDAPYFRREASDEWIERYRENKAQAQAWARQHLSVDTSRNWPFNSQNRSDS